jgi:hypothetical protein
MTKTNYFRLQNHIFAFHHSLIGKYWRFRLGDIKGWLEENRHVELTNA